MNTNSKRLGIYLSVMLIATAVATALRTVACVSGLDYASGFFTNRALISTANLIVTFTAIGVFSYLLSPKIKLIPSFSTGATFVPTGILGVATAFLGVKIFSYVAATNNYRIFTKELFTLAGVPTLLGLLTGVLAFVSIAYYFFNAFVAESRDVVRAYFSIAAISFLALYAVMIYIDGSISLNESSKILRQTSFLLIAIFLLYEARISLGREMWRTYTAFGLAAAILTAYTSIPAIVTYFVNGAIVSSSGYKSLATLEEYLFLLAMFIFIIARLCLTITLFEDKKNELVEALKTMALTREADVIRSLEEHEKIFTSKQLSIFDLYGDDDFSETEESEEFPESTEKEEEKAPMISDAAIYESIFGKMPDAPEAAEENTEEKEESKEETDIEETVEKLIKINDDSNKDSSDI